MKLLTLKVKQSLLDSMELAVNAGKAKDRSDFVRGAIVERLHELKIDVPSGAGLSESRIGKGGPRVRYPDHAASSLNLNETNSTLGDAEKEAAAKAAASARRRKSK